MIYSVSTHHLGQKYYELKDHLGNVRATITDLRTMQSNIAQASVESYNNYYAFGMLMPGRTGASENYRYAFNGKEHDPDFNSSVGAIYDYGFRIYDTRIAKFLSVDPLTKEYPMLTPYQFASNTPIMAIDVDGLESFNANRLLWEAGTAMLRHPIPSKSNITVFWAKMAFETSLAKEFINQYAYKKGEKYNMSESEMEECNVTPVKFSDFHKSAYPKIEGLKAGESRYIEFDNGGTGVANTSGTLGSFNIEVKGTFTWSKDGKKWNFSGKMRFVDYWDFNIETKEQKEARMKSGNVRTPEAEKEVEWANKNLPGQPFRAESEWVPVNSNSDNEEFSWFKGKSSENIPNRRRAFLDK